MQGGLQWMEGCVQAAAMDGGLCVSCYANPARTLALLSGKTGTCEWEDWHFWGGKSGKAPCLDARCAHKPLP